MFVLGLAIPDHQTSEAENRTLQMKPQVSISSIASGRFQNEFQDYISDQFPLRTLWADIQVSASTLVGGFESNGVFRCHDGYLMQKFEKPAADSDKPTPTKAIIRFQKKHPGIETHALIAPTAGVLYEDKLPTGAYQPNEGAYLEKVQKVLKEYNVDVIDVTPTLQEHAGEDLFYRTDHHWTSYAAYLSFLAAADQLGVSPDTAYTNTLLTKHFSGSLKSKSGYFLTRDDNLSAYIPDSGSFNCVVTYVDDQRKTSSPYEADALDGSDPYQVFFGGNHPLVRIESTNANDRVLLVVKDSYANCFIPFLIDQYQKIVIVDPRYNFDSLNSIVKSESVTEALFLYNASTYAMDTSLAGMMGL